MNTPTSDKTTLNNRALDIQDLFNLQYDFFRAVECGNAIMLLREGIRAAKQQRELYAMGFRSVEWMCWAMRKGRNNQTYRGKNGRRQLGSIPAIRLVALAAYWNMTLDELAALGRARLNEQEKAA